MQARGGETARLRWAVPVAALYVTLLSLLLAINLIKVGHPPDLTDPAWLTLAGLLVIWALELIGVRWPRIVLVLLTALGVGYLVRTFNNGVAPLYLFLLVVWVSYTGTRRQSYVALGLSLATLVPFWAQYDISVPWTVGLVSMWLGVQALIAQRRTLGDLRAAQADLAAQAASAERQRIAGEIHDVVAHSLAVTMLHLTGARHILQRDPRRAEEALAQAERLGRQSLAEVRRTVGLLQTPDSARVPGAPVSTPLSTASDIRGLVHEYAVAGMDVRATIDGDLDRLPTGVSVALYRIAQEALANVARHATGAETSLDVLVDEARRCVNLRVRDSGGVADLSIPERGEAGTGLGLTGMRRRAELLGGTFAAGRDPSGVGWLVECALPLTCPD